MLWRWMDARIKSGHDGDTLWARSRSGCTLFSDSIFKQPQTIRCRAVIASRWLAMTCNPDTVIPGWSAGPDPESRDSGFDASHRPGMTVSAPIPNVTSRSRDAMRPSCTFIFRPLEGVGNAGRPLHPRPRVHLVLIERTRVTTSTPESPDIPARNGFTAYVGLSPVTGLFCHRRQRIWSCLSPVGPTQLRELDASVGASGPHDFAVRSNISRQRAGDRSQVFRLALRSHRAQNAAASTASRALRP